uniref:Uncharacterized protein n=1 Tax=Hemiselmis andersenii TaxID=464988 RepID=A0A7S0Y492_HEMAN
MERRREGRAGQFVTGKMSSREAEKSLDNYWNQFPTPKPDAPPRHRGAAGGGGAAHESHGARETREKRQAHEALGGSEGGSENALGLPEGGDAAVTAPLHKVTSAQAHKSIDGYFDRLVHHAQLKDTYHEKARAERTSMAAAKLKEQERAAYELDQEAKARAKQAAAPPPAPAPAPAVSPQQAYYAQTYENFLSQVSKQASAQLRAPPQQQPWMQAPVQETTRPAQQQQQQQGGQAKLWLSVNGQPVVWRTQYKDLPDLMKRRMNQHQAHIQECKQHSESIREILQCREARHGRTPLTTSGWTSPSSTQLRPLTSKRR